ncbi:hypothetical protein NKH18_25390 [Streptomyces sp. M10(2022)]
MRDIVSHIIGMECEQLGDPRPIHTLPRDLYHVQNDQQRYVEMQVDVRRHHTAPEMTSELEYTLIRRMRQLRNERARPRPWCGLPRSRADPGTRAAHEGLRRLGARAGPAYDAGSAGRPGLPGALVARDTLLAALPKVVAKDAGAPPIRRWSSMCTAPWSSCAPSGSTQTDAARWTARRRWVPRRR